MKNAVYQCVKNPFLFLFLAIYLLSSYILSQYTGESVGEQLSMFIFFVILAVLMYLITWKTPINDIHIKKPRQESLFFIAYFTFWIAVNLGLWRQVFSQSSWVSNGISFWVLLVIVPALILGR